MIKQFGNEKKGLAYEAFSVEPNKGNSASVVLNGDDFTDEEMQGFCRLQSTTNYA